MKSFLLVVELSATLMSASAASDLEERAELKRELDLLHETRLELAEQLAQLDRQIAALEAELAQRDPSPSAREQISTSVFEAIVAYERPDLNSAEAFMIPAEQSFEVSEPLSDEWWPVGYDGKHGYARIASELINSKLFDLMRARNARLRLQEEEAERAAAEQRARERAQRAAQEASRRREQLVAKWGESVGSKLADGQVWVGMTEKMLRDARGTPDEVTKSVSADGETLILVYRAEGMKHFFYLEGGVLTSWQQDLR